MALSTLHNIDGSWDSTSLQIEDQDGTLLLTNTLLQQLSQLIYERDLRSFSEEEIGTIDTVVYTIFDLYLQSEITVKLAIAKIIGDNYIKCLVDLNEIVHNTVGKYNFSV